MDPEPKPQGDPSPGNDPPPPATAPVDAAPPSGGPLPDASPEPAAVDARSDSAPQPDPEPGAASAPSPTSSPERRRNQGGLRDRIAQDRAAQRARVVARLTGPLPKIVFAIALACFGVWLVRAPIYRVLARQGGQVGGWALDRLAEMRDAGSFDLFVEQMGSSNDTARYHHLIFLLGGRDRAPVRGEPLPPDVPERVTEHLAAIRAGLNHESADRRRGSLRALWALRKRSWTRGEATLTEVAELLSPSQDLRTRCYAALVLTASPPPASVRPALLQAALKDRSREVRRFAVEALGGAGEASVAQDLEPGLRDEAPEVRREVRLAMVRLGAPASFEALAEIYRSDRDVHKPQVLQALIQLKDPRLEALLLEALSARLPGLRAIAVTGLAGVGGVTARRGIERALRDEDASVRLAAVDALAERTDAAASVPALVDAISRAGDAGWEEVRRLHATLSKLTDAAVPDPIQSQIGSWQKCIDAWEAWLERRP